jgi:hypothetical protein
MQPRNLAVVDPEPVDELAELLLELLGVLLAEL